MVVKGVERRPCTTLGTHFTGMCSKWCKFKLASLENVLKPGVWQMIVHGDDEGIESLEAALTSTHNSLESLEELDDNDQADKDELF